MYKKAFELSYKNKKVEIEIQDFVGDVRNINGTEDLFSLSYISDSKDKGQSILVTEADINFYADDYFNIDELKTVGETDIKVKYYEDDSLLWSGFVIPDFFSTSVDIAPVVSMVATDRVGTLKEISNNSESNIPIQILASCLKQTGQDLPINIIADNNYFETPVQLERIDEIASYDVIRTFMVLFNCKITLYKNAWWVVNKKLLESGFVNYKSYNSDGAGGSVTPFAQPILNIDLVDRDGQREIKPTASEISLFLEFGGSKKYPKNWDFEKWNGSSFNDWTAKNGFIPKLNTKQITGYTFEGGVGGAGGYYKAIYGTDILDKSLYIKTSGADGNWFGNYYTKPHLESGAEKIPFKEDFVDVTININFTTASTRALRVIPLIRKINTNPSQHEYFAIQNSGEVTRVGRGSIDLDEIESLIIDDSSDGSNLLEAVQSNWEKTFKVETSKIVTNRGNPNADIRLLIFEPRLNHFSESDVDVFVHSAQFIFNKNEQAGKGLIFKIKQGGEKFSKSREPETILFSDKINQGVNGYFYNYKYDDTSIVELPSEFALSSVRERADMFSKARDFYSLDGDFIVNPLAKYVCGLKSFVLIGGENRREDAGIIVEEIVSNTLNRTDFIYTYFDDGKDKVKSIGTASGGSSSSGGGGGVSSPQLWKVDEDGNIYTEYNAYSLKNLSAFGLGEDEGGGVIINVIDSLTSTSKTDPLSANMGRYLKTLIDNIEVGEGGQVIVDWEAITGKPTTFNPSAHTHIIGNVTGLQSALDGKASLAQLDDKEDKFTKNSAFNKNFGTGLNDVARGNHTHSFASLTSKPTTLGGYGITDGAKSADLASHISDVTNPHSVTKAQIGLSNVTNDKQAKEVHTHVISDVTNLQTELDKKATNTALTTHINKTDNPHSITKSQVGLGNVANKDLSNVDNIQQATKAEFTSHKNLFDSMFRKVGTNIEAKLSLYSLGGLSAYGFSDEGSSGGGGGIVNILSDWAIYDASKAGWALGAGLGKSLYDNKADKTDPRFTDARTPLAHTHSISDVSGLQTALNSKTNQTFSDGLNTRLTSVEGGSATTVNTNGSGNAITSISKSGNIITAKKDLTFALPSDISNAIDGLEIGGRNLLLNSKKGWNSTAYNIINERLSEDWQPGQTYTISLKGTINEGQYFRVYRDAGSNAFLRLQYNEKTGLYTGTGTISAGATGNIITIYNQPSSETFDATVGWVKVEKGNKATDWTPAPEDQVSDWLTTDINNFSFIKNKPTKLNQFSNVETAFINKSQADGWYSDINHKSHPYLDFPTASGLTPYIGNMGSDGTFGMSIEGNTYLTGLAIGGGSKKLLWKGNDVFYRGNLSKSDIGLSNVINENYRNFAVYGDNSIGTTNLLANIDETIRSTFYRSNEGSGTLGINVAHPSSDLYRMQIQGVAYNSSKLRTRTKNNSWMAWEKIWSDEKWDIKRSGEDLNFNYNDLKKITIGATGTLTALGGNSTNWNSAFAHISVKTNPHDVTKAQVGLGNVTNESKATMFTNPTFTGTTKVTILELSTNWKFVKVGNNIELQYNGVTKQIMTNNGDIIATAGVTAYQ